MTTDRLEELRQIAGGIGAPKSEWMDELIDEIAWLRDENERLKAQLATAREALAGALVLANCYFELQGRDGFNNDNYCRLLDTLALLDGKEPMQKDAKPRHPALQRTWWVNLYPNGQCTGTLCETRESALNRCTHTGDTPDAEQVEVRIVPVPDKRANPIRREFPAQKGQP